MMQERARPGAQMWMGVWAQGRVAARHQASCSLATDCPTEAGRQAAEVARPEVSGSDRRVTWTFPGGRRAIPDDELLDPEPPAHQCEDVLFRCARLCGVYRGNAA